VARFYGPQCKKYGALRGFSVTAEPRWVDARTISKRLYINSTIL